MKVKEFRPFQFPLFFNFKPVQFSGIMLLRMYVWSCTFLYFLPIGTVCLPNCYGQ